MVEYLIPCDIWFDLKFGITGFTFKLTQDLNGNGKWIKQALLFKKVGALAFRIIRPYVKSLLIIICH